VAVPRGPAALSDDCSRATLIVTPRPTPPGCAATVIDRRALRETGAMALYRRDGNFEVTAARPSTLDRPWARRYPARDAPPAPSSTKPPELDATPPPDADAEE
jgi:competence protein ComEC